jgi:hypothetical protein
MDCIISSSLGGKKRSGLHMWPALNLHRARFLSCRCTWDVWRPANRAPGCVAGLCLYCRFTFAFRASLRYRTPSPPFFTDSVRHSNDRLTWAWVPYDFPSALTMWEGLAPLPRATAARLRRLNLSRCRCHLRDGTSLHSRFCFSIIWAPCYVRAPAGRDP